MLIDHLAESVTFSDEDMHFVKKFGLMTATDMVLMHAEQSDLPFIFDTFQLAGFFGVSHRDLHRLLRNVNERYQSITIRKRSGGVRQLHAPHCELAYIQRRILDDILDKMPVSPYATAYKRHTNLKVNATPHCGKQYLLKMDLEDFFGTVQFHQIISTVFHSRHFPRQIGTILTTLCCHDDVLPQGAPTSPALSNLVMKHFDDVMGEWCHKRALSYTRYCDDITISGDTPLYAAYRKAKGLLEREGFIVNERKTHFISCANRQTVTGLNVNTSPSVPREYRRSLRQELYYVENYGVADAIVRGNRVDFLAEDEPQILHYLDHLEGKVRYVMQFHREPYWSKALQLIHRLRCDAPSEATPYVPHFRFTAQ